MYDEPMGITRIAGRCAYNETDLEDLPGIDSVAFRMDDRAQLSISTGHVFQRGFPQDFSILIVARPTPGKTKYYFFFLMNTKIIDEIGLKVKFRLHFSQYTAKMVTNN